MELFKQLPGFTPSPPGIERVALRYLPAAAIWGTLALSLMLLAVRLFLVDEWTAALSRAEIFIISLTVLYWGALLTGTIAAIIVMVMKGPAYVADAYPLPDSDQPDVETKVFASPEKKKPLM